MAEEETKKNPYIGEDIKKAMQRYNPSEMTEFESQFYVGSKDKQTIVAESNKEIQRLLTAYLKRAGEKRSQESGSSEIQAAKAFIAFIKNTCIDIIRSKCAIRQSLQYMYEIMESKPVDKALDTKGKKLWKNLKNTLETLNNANSEMLEVSHKYFGFLLKFWEALGEFCRQQTKFKPPSMEISIGALTKHLYDFIQFKQSYDAAIEKVNEAAKSGMKLFDEVIGGQAIADAFKQRTKIQNNLNELINKLKEIQLLSINKQEGYNKEKAENEAKIVMNGEEIKYHEGIYKSIEDWQKKRRRSS